tara:strand:- start:249 stop:806 length:558 start_codon:yes stop_codon:yes gene_type:complete
MISLLNKFIFLNILKWKITGDIPIDKKLIFAVGPHTSAYDFFVGLFFRSHLKMENQIKFIGKAELFQIPIFGLFLRSIGGIPVIRNQSNNSVDYLVNVINDNKEIYLSLFPEGTRSKVDKLKTGFYFIALKSKIPIQPIGFDFEKRIVDFGKKFNPSGDIDKDMKHITSYFSKFKGKFPENGLNH